MAAAPRGTNERGWDAAMSLRQLLWVLSGLLILALLVSGVAASYVARSRVQRAQAEVEAIAAAVRAFARDVSDPSPTQRAASASGDTAAVDLLVGPGDVPKTRVADGWSVARSDTIDNQLRANAPGYPVPAGSAAGWNGPYLAHDCPVDPWGNRYMVNVGGAASRGGNGSPRAVWALSAGPDGVIETPAEQPAEAARLHGDDVGARVR